MHQAKAEPRGSLHSVRRGSFDIRSVASEGIRRTSLAKLSALPLEAPITKVRYDGSFFLLAGKRIIRFCNHFLKMVCRLYQY